MYQKIVFKQHDCNDYMSKKTTVSDIAIVDPPFGINESSKDFSSRNTPIKQKNGKFLNAPKTEYKKKDWDKDPPNDEYFDLLFKTSKIQLVFGANYFKQIVGQAFKPPRRIDFDEFIKKNPKHWIIWDKVNGNNCFNDCDLIWCSEPIDSFVVKYMWSGMFQGKSIKEGHIQQGNKKLNEKKFHPTQKPVIIYKFLLELFKDRIKTVFDSHVGSGNIIFACICMGLDFEGCEIDKDYFLSADQRIKEKLDSIFNQMP